MINPTIVIEFKGGETLDHVYKIQIETLNQAITLNSMDKKRLHDIRLDLLDKLAFVENLQSQIHSQENKKQQAINGTSWNG